MVYKAEKSEISNNLVLAIGITVLFLLTLFQLTDSLRLKTVITMVLMLLFFYSIYFGVMIQTLYYDVDEHRLVMGSRWSFLNVSIPMEEMEGYTRRITLIDQGGIAGVLNKRFSIGKSYVEGIGKVNMFVTNSKKAVYLRTVRGNFAVSPENAAAFTAALEGRGVPEKNLMESLHPAELRRSEQRFNQYFLFNAVLILVYLLIPVSLFYLDRLPDYIAMVQENAQGVTMLPVDRYIDQTIWYGVGNFVVLMVAAAVSKLYSSIDKLYYYRVLLAPVIMTVLLLVTVVSTLLPTFF